MKAAFFFLFVALLAAGVWIAAPSLNVRKYLNEANEKALLEHLETVLDALGEKFPNSIIARQVESTLGLCRVMDLPPPTTPNPFANIRPIPGVYFPFSKPVDLEGVSLLCGFPGHGKSMLLFPVVPSAITIHRWPEKPGALTLEFGHISLVSDQVDLEVDLPTMRLRLKSDKPVSLTIQKMPNQFAILIRLGKLDVTYELVPGDESKARPVLIQLEPGSILTSDGKELSQKKSMRLLPSGFQEDSSLTISEAPATAVGTTANPIGVAPAPAPAAAPAVSTPQAPAAPNK